MKQFALWATLVGVWVTAAPALAAVPDVLPLQGVLTDGTGTPVVDGVYTVSFALYPSADASTAVWTESWPPAGIDCATSPEACVTTHGGVFQLLLGHHVSLGPQLFQTHPDLHLGISIEGEPQLPRTPFGSTAYAFHAATAADAATLEGFSALDFEPAGGGVEAVAQHEAAVPHLSPEQHAALTGGAGTNADALHTHTSLSVQVSSGPPHACGPNDIGGIYLDSADEQLHLCTVSGWVSGQGPPGPPGGSNVVHTTSSTVYSLGSDWAATDIAVTITPSTSTPRLLVMASVQAYTFANTSNGVGLLRITRDGVALPGTTVSQHTGYAGANDHGDVITLMTVDLPPGPGPYTYAVEARSAQGTFSLNQISGQTTSSNIIAQEL